MVLCRYALIIFISCVTAESSCSLKTLPAIPISKATKRSFSERPPSPERPRYLSLNYGMVSVKLEWPGSAMGEVSDWEKVAGSKPPL